MNEVVQRGTQFDVVVHNDQTSPLYAYVTAIDPSNGDYYVLYSQDEIFRWEVKQTLDSSVPVYYTSGDSGYEIQLPPGQNTTFYLPDYVVSGRIYISYQRLRFGTTQGGPNEGFVQPSVSNPSLPEYNATYQYLEFTYLENAFYADLTNMDFVSIPLGLKVVSTTGTTTSIPGLVANATQLICRALQNQTAYDKYNWAKLCVHDSNEKLIRVLSPTQYLAMHPTDNFSTYYDPYVDAVWNTYKSKTLTINTQDSDPSGRNSSKVEVGKMVNCSVDADELLACYGGNNQYTFVKPKSSHIFGCTQEQGSPFIVKSTDDRTQAEIIPRLCAAFQRSTLLLEGGDIQPNAKITADRYYTANITNHYARIVHYYEQEGMGYAFAYDDVNPIGEGIPNATENAAGVIQEQHAKLLFVTIGG